MRSDGLFLEDSRLAGNGNGIYLLPSHIVLYRLGFFPLENQYCSAPPP